MKTQISKISFDAEKRYSGVYQQQGRMLTDADWNNLVDILKGHLAEALKDVVGNGSPRNGSLTVTSDRNIQLGDLYMDGLRAVLPGRGTIAASKQPDLPKSPDLSATGPYVVYADVWERSLTALEDSGLRDPGLNGADTCTRTQTMLQIKTCAADVNPEKDIPQKGDAELSLDLHDNLEAGDPCDPCAGVVGAGAGRVGNYLFRLEVHAVIGNAAQPTGLTLKWSSENGAEQYEAKSEGLMPPGFVNSRFLYEFYDLTTEKHPGVHLTAGFTPLSGRLKTPYKIPDGAADPKEFVRRWDGYCELEYTPTKLGWILVKGWDKGVDLSTNIAKAQHGHVALGSALTVNLEAFLMNLELKDKTFVVGDYWLAPVREAVHSADSSVCSKALPDGIEHHYLRLATVNAKGRVKLYEDEADRRRHTFPPLTDLHAQDVGFQKPCNTGIYQDQTVTTVEDALNLLCDIRASQVSYQAGAGCVYLNKPHIKTVQNALDALCKQSTSGRCKVTVGKGGDSLTIEEAINAFIGADVFDFCLCLLPGKHTLGEIRRKEALPYLNLSITGCGPGTVLQPTESGRFDGIGSLLLEHLRIDSLEGEHPVVISNCGEVTLNEVLLLGMAPEEALLRVSDTVQVSMNHCVMEAYQDLKVPKKVFDFAQELASLFALPGREAFLEAASIQAKKLAQMDIKDRRIMADNLEVMVKEFADIISRNELLSYQQLIQVLRSQSPSNTQFLDGLQNIRHQAHQDHGTELATFSGINYLHLEHLRIDSLEGEHPVVISNCGEVTLNEVLLLGMAPEEALLRVSDTVQVSMNDCVMEAYQDLKVPTKIFDFAQELASLFALPGREAFLEAASIQAIKLSYMNIKDRRIMADNLEVMVKEFADIISRNELLSYQQLIQVLRSQGPSNTQFLDALQNIRDQEQVLIVPKEVFDYVGLDELTNLFTRPDRGTFLESAAIPAEQLTQMSIDDRKEIALKLNKALTEIPVKISRNELFSYQRLIQVLPLSSPCKAQFLDALRDIRDQAHHTVAANALIFNDALARVSILNSRIYGQITLYGPPGDDVLDEEEIKTLTEMLQKKALTLVPQATDFIVQGTLLTRLALSDSQVNKIHYIIGGGKDAMLTGFYEAAQIADSVFAANGNLLLFGETTLNGNNVESLEPVVGSVIGETAIYTGNRVYRRVLLNDTSPVGGGRMLTGVRELQKAANMPENSW